MRPATALLLALLTARPSGPAAVAAPAPPPAPEPPALPRPLPQAAAPPVMLAEVYHEGDTLNLPAWRVSEKFDGVRAWWDGHRLLTRSGAVIAAPAWFTAGWPATPLDGELWAGRGRFEQASAIVRRQQASDPDWRTLRYEVFDLPAAPGDFDARLRALQITVQAIDQPWVAAVEQRRCGTPADLRAAFETVVAAGGEGLMLKRGDSTYAAGRSRDLLKYKPFDDAEAVVVGYEPGQGRLQGLVGSLVVEDPQGRRFRLGSGLTDAERRDPPAIGSTVTYAHSGRTADGLPRFARFLRVRRDR